ncbi:hypothetical protein [Methanoculleus sp. 7T]|jgi:hypothetical protein|uniref:hypothetical protein n=1 Tax=Methanoculleus sp. 7T TaxID=2937282 RepID=UPI0020C0103F|nr:hypothetical protein [Methanoculleus sp. 7T]MCK8517483.1 hypothetical protein [Methanoculleus sp. 7T]
MILEGYLLVVLIFALLFESFMMYVMYRRIVQQQEEIRSMRGRIELTNADYDMLLRATQSVRNLR